MPRANHTFTALGTYWSIETPDILDGTVITAIAEMVALFDQRYSRFRDDSLIAAMARTPGRYDLAEDGATMLHFYRHLYDLTSGAVTPLAGAMLERAGYDASYSFQAQAQEPLPAWDDAMTLNGTVLQTHQPVTLDFGAAGKGRLIDRISHLLQHAGITSYIVDGSGDLRHAGTPPITVGLEHPHDASLVIGTTPLQNQSLCASSPSRRAWGKGLHHIFDPRTLAPVEDVVATWVITQEAMIADGLATALFFCEPAALNRMFDFQYVRYHNTNTIDYSNTFQGELFS